MELRWSLSKSAKIGVCFSFRSGLAASLRMDKLFPMPPEAIDTSSSGLSQGRFMLSEHEKMPLIHVDTVSDCVARVLEIFPDVKRDRCHAGSGIECGCCFSIFRFVYYL
jgi:hypothetical protein